MARTPVSRPSPKAAIKVGKRTLRVGDTVKFQPTVTRISEGDYPQVTVQFGETGIKMTVPLSQLPDQD